MYILVPEFLSLGQSQHSRPKEQLEIPENTEGLLGILEHSLSYLLQVKFLYHNSFL